MSVLIATPVRGSVFEMAYVIGLMQCNGLYGGWMPYGGQGDIHLARDVLAGAFRQSKHDSLVFIDSDIGFTRADLQALIETKEPIVSGLYPSKGSVAEWICRDLDHKVIPLEELPTTGLKEVGMVPGGFLKIDREVFDTIAASGRVASYGGGKHHQFFQGCVIRDELCSEDYSFSALAAECGYKLYVNCAIALEHGGRRLR